MSDLYRHFKGNLYRTLGIAVHTELGEALVIYQRADIENGELWARPYNQFHGMHGSGVKRFERVDEEDAE